jgi:hypothetical protein
MTNSESSHFVMIMLVEATLVLRRPLQSVAQINNPRGG